MMFNQVNTDKYLINVDEQSKWLEIVEWISMKTSL